MILDMAFWDFIFSCLLLQIALTLNWVNKNKGQESRLIITTTKKLEGFGFTIY